MTVVGIGVVVACDVAVVVRALLEVLVALRVLIPDSTAEFGLMLLS